MSHRPFESPPPYRPDEYKPSNYAPSRAMYGGEMHSQPAYSYYPEDEEIQHFYKWSSPPGIIRIMAILIVVMCVGIFACVASTLPWDMDMSRQNMGYGGGTGTGLGGGYGGYGFGGSQMGIGFAYGGNYTDPRSAKGFILAMTAFCFIFALAVFIMSATRTQMSTTRKFYLIVLIISGILGGMMFIASIVFTIGVNPVAQASGSSFYNQIVSICSQFYTPALTGVYMDQYLYHYCVVEPQEAIAIVLGFLVVVAFAIIIFFGVKTRKKINRCGKMNILWRKNNFAEEGDPQVEEWVKNVSSPEAVPAMSEYSGKVNGSVMEYRSVNGVQSYPPPIPEEAFPVKNDTGLSPNGYSSSSDGTNKKDFHKKHFSRPRRSSIDHYDTDYNTGAESGEELDDDDNDWDSEYPPITSNQQRQEYKKEFDTGLQDYKKMQGELDDIIKSLSQLDKELDELPEDSQAYKKAAGEYNRLKEIKASPSYQSKKKRCKQLKNKLNHIKKMVSDYDRNK